MWLNNSMADKFTRFLTGVGQGLTNPKGNLGDNRHASRMFVDGAMAKAPRTKFSFHVYFEVNPKAVRSKEFLLNYKNDIGMLVKSASLPRFNFETDTMNQYNKKKIIYKQINYEPVSIKMHDDSAGITNALWALYYGYYSPERQQYTNDAWSTVNMGPYRKSNDTTNKFKYGLDQFGVEEPFLKSVTIYTMAKKRFNSYQLVNPHIVTWDHGDVDYGQSGAPMESNMTLKYETVLYGSGAITKGGEPTGFGEINYDQTPSPLSVLGGGTSSIFGPGGILSGAAEIVNAGSAEIFGDLYKEGLGQGSVGVLQAALGAVNLYRNIGNINGDTLRAEAFNIALTPNRAVNTISGLPGVSFPGSGGQ